MPVHWILNISLIGRCSGQKEALQSHLWTWLWSSLRRRPSLRGAQGKPHRRLQLPTWHHITNLLFSAGQIPKIKKKWGKNIYLCERRMLLVLGLGSWTMQCFYFSKRRPQLSLYRSWINSLSLCRFHYPYFHTERNEGCKSTTLVVQMASKQDKTKNNKQTKKN